MILKEIRLASDITIICNLMETIFSQSWLTMKILFIFGFTLSEQMRKRTSMVLTYDLVRIKVEMSSAISPIEFVLCLHPIICYLEEIQDTLYYL